MVLSVMSHQSKDPSSNPAERLFFSFLFFFSFFFRTGHYETDVLLFSLSLSVRQKSFNFPSIVAHSHLDLS